MSTSIKWQRQQEIINELQLTSHYFEQLLAEFNQYENLSLPGDEWQIVQHIQESIMLLQWRLETLSTRTRHGLAQPQEQSTHPRPFIRHTDIRHTDETLISTDT